ncbi:unnamed protein product, partial [Coregonus sp. 'balchen']
MISLKWLIDQALLTSSSRCWGPCLVWPLDDITKWRVTKINTLSALMDSNDGLIGISKSIFGEETFVLCAGLSLLMHLEQGNHHKILGHVEVTPWDALS